MTKENIKRYIVSSAITFIATFFVTVGTLMSQDTFIFSQDAILATIVAGTTTAGRAFFKLIYEIGLELLKKE